MKSIFKILYIFFIPINLTAAPWDVDLESRQILETQIEEKHTQRVNEAKARNQEYTNLNFELAYINFSENEYIEDSNLHTDLESRLQKHGFQKLDKRPKPQAHCYGISLVFTQYLLNHPQFASYTCKNILSQMQNDPLFAQKAHLYSSHQHAWYYKEHSYPLELFPSDMKDYFYLLLGEIPSDYYSIPIVEDKHAVMDKVSIYATLKNLPNKVLVVGLMEMKEDHYKHCIVVCTHPDKLLVLDPNYGLFEYPDLETLSYATEKALKEYEFRFLAVFPLKGE